MRKTGKKAVYNNRDHFDVGFTGSEDTGFDSLSGLRYALENNRP